MKAYVFTGGAILGRPALAHVPRITGEDAGLVPDPFSVAVTAAAAPGR